MILNSVQELRNQMFIELADDIDISETQKKVAHDRYKAVSEHLAAPPSDLNEYNPSIYTQGSFALGTVVRPVNGGDDFDLDIVCELDIDSEYINQLNLKNIIGDRLKEDMRYQRMLKEKNRCWRLNYSEGTQFHMDILPAIPANERRQIYEMRMEQFGKNAILIPDKELKSWKHSNPKDFANWFRARMHNVFTEQKSILAAISKVDIDKIPDYRVKTPLQRCIQLLKRHRDIFYSDRSDKPISIIITTLAGMYYQGESSIIDTLDGIIEGFNNDPGIVSGTIYNPVDPTENFADKWSKYPDRQKAFHIWATKLKTDFNKIIILEDVNQIAKISNSIFGEKTATRAANKVVAMLGSGIVVKPPVVRIHKPSRPWQP